MVDEVPCYVVFSALLLPHLFWAQKPSRTFSAYVSPSELETKLHNHIKQQTKLQFCIFWSLYFWIAKWKTKDSALNDSKHFLTSVCSVFLHEWNFDVLGLFPHDKWVPVTTSGHILRLWIKEWPPMWRVAANILNKQSRTADRGWSPAWRLGEVLTTPCSKNWFCCES